MFNHENLLAVILAGGQSRRFNGRDKTFQIDKGEYLLDKSVKYLDDKFSNIIINHNGNDNRLIHYPYPIIRDDTYNINHQQKGPLCGILATLKWAKSNDYSEIFSFPIDTHHFPKQLIETVYQTYYSQKNKKLINCADYKQTQYLLGIWSVDLIDLLNSYINSDNTKVKNFIDSLGNKSQTIDFKEHLFRNINYPKDLQIG